MNKKIRSVQSKSALSIEKVAIIAAAFVVFLAFIIVGVFWYSDKYQKSSDQIKQQNNKSTEQNARSISEIDTSDWKTYENKELGVTFKYPSDWGLYEDKDTSEWKNYNYYTEQVKSNIIKLVEVKNLGKDEEPSCGIGSKSSPGISISLEVSKNSNNYSLQQLQQECLDGPDPTVCEASIKMINKNQVLIHAIDDVMRCGEYPAVQIVKNDRIYSLSVVWSDNSETDISPERFFYAILNSLEIK